MWNGTKTYDTEFEGEDDLRTLTYTDGFGLTQPDEIRRNEPSGSQQWGGRSFTERRKPAETTRLALITANSTPKKVRNYVLKLCEINSELTLIAGEGEEIDDG